MARYGGEEFLIVMPGIVAEVLSVADRLRDRVGDMPVRTEKGAKVAVTLSMGIVMAPHGADAEAVIATVDGALYEAKRQGRNCAVMVPFPGASPPEGTGIAGPNRSGPAPDVF